MNTTIAKRQVRGLNSTFFFFLHVCAVCMHVCARVSACILGPKLDKGCLPSLLSILHIAVRSPTSQYS